MNIHATHSYRQRYGVQSCAMTVGTFVVRHQGFHFRFYGTALGLLVSSFQGGYYAFVHFASVKKIVKGFLGIFFNGVGNGQPVFFQYLRENLQQNGVLSDIPESRRNDSAVKERELFVRDNEVLVYCYDISET